VGYHGLPRLTTYAFGGDRALQVWYRDTTLRWVSFNELVARREMDVATIVEFQAHGPRPIVLLEVEAVRRLVRADELYKAGRHREALVELGEAERLEPDLGAWLFRSMVAGRRALCLAALGVHDQSESEAQRCLGLHRDNADGHLVLALLWGDLGRFAEAEAQVDTVLRIEPTNLGAARLREVLRAGRAGLLPELPAKR
jgi:tetratricopeptide (TPR) repeat protein